MRSTRLSRWRLAGLARYTALGAAAAAGPAAWAADPAAIAAGLDPDVVEVATNGRWEAGGRKGAFRALVIHSGGTGGRRIAQVFVQWVAPRADGTGSDVIAVLPVDKLNQLNAENAALTLDSELTNEATLLVQSYDPANDADQSLTVKLGPPGQMSVEEPGPAE